MPTACLLMFGTLIVAQVDPLEPVDAWTSGLESPARLAVTTNGVLVTDPQADAVVRFDGVGTYLGTWTESAGPVGIAVHPDGRIFVSRRDDAKVAVYDSSFAFQHFLAVPNPLPDFDRPTDLAMDTATGRLYVVDSGGDRIYGFNSDESLALMLGIRGSHSSEFKYPSAIAIDSLHGRIFVADQDNFRIQIFDTAGVFQRSFGYRIKYVPGGGEEGWMPRTAGLAVDAAGNVYVADALMSTVRLFTAAGAELGKIVEYGSDPGDLRTPGGVAVDASGRVYVANSGAGRVEVYNPPPGGFRTSGRHYEGTNSDAAFFELMKVRGLSLSPSLTAGRSLAIGLGLVEIPGWDPPHMLDDVICGRCHDVDGQPGGHLGTIEGQANLCFSCHTGGGSGLASLVRPTEHLGMSHAWGVPAVNPAVGSVGPAPGGAMAPYLKNGDIKCATCHDQHTNQAASPYLRAPADAMCQECHANHTIHTPNGSWQPTCTECHVAHDPNDRNLSLVAALVHNQTLGVDEPVVFTARTGPNSFDDGDPAAEDGICQVCHTATSFHRQDGAGPVHFDGQDCITCHPHDAGFLPAGGGCLACHSGPQGPRRAVAGEFPEDDAHAHYGAALEDDACLVCHSVATHMNGYVELIDADDESLYSFQQPADLASDPDLSNFCASCHDADGAMRLATPLDPFGNGNAPPDVATKFLGTLQWDEWYGGVCFGSEGTLRPVNSHHDISDIDQAFSGAKIECLDCHGAHTASASQPTADPFDTTAAWTGDGNAFCLQCHGGGAGPLDPGFPPGVVGPVMDADTLLQLAGYPIPDVCTNGDCSSLRGLDSCDYQDAMWYVDYAWTHTAHGPDSKRGWQGYSGAPGATLDCVVCHDPHGSYTPSNPAGNPYLIRDVVDGTPFVDDGVRPGPNWTGPPWDTYGTTRSVTVTVNGTTVDWGGPNGLCSVCHATWLDAYGFHSTCTGCQTCHGHGMLWGESDWVGFDDDVSCSEGLRSGGDESDPSLTAPERSEPPIHLRAPNGLRGRQRLDGRLDTGPRDLAPHK